MSSCLSIDNQRGVATVTLRRPEAHNALNPELIRELTGAFTELGRAAEVRAVVLAAEGRSFCAGADLESMRRAAAAGEAENLADALRLARMFQAVYDCPKPVVARVQGAVFGGGIGLVAACDLVAALEQATFCFSEVKLGLIPAVISPFVLRKVAPGVARRYFLTAERFDAPEARRLGLVSEVAASMPELDDRVRTWTEQLRQNGPEAMAACKRLLEEVSGPDWERLLPLVAQQIAERRASEEGQEGLRAFLEKRPPNWRLEEEGDHVP